MKEENMLDNKVINSPVAAIFKMETKEASNVNSKREDRRRKSVESAQSTGSRSALLSDGPPTAISDEHTNRKSYSELSKE